MSRKHILIFGASYGSLLGMKLVLAGHDVTMICLPAEAELFNAEGAIVRMPIKGREALVELRSKGAPGRLAAIGAGDIKLGDYHLAVLAMQEPQYRSPGVREALDAVAKAGLPCMSIMNMPPYTYLKRLPGLDVTTLRDCYTDASVWDAFDPNKMTLCSPDPQAFRPPEEKVNVLQVRLPTNFKSASFPDAKDTALLRELEADIDAVRFDAGGDRIELPVKLKLHDSVFVPLAKWAMLVAGNYRCVQADGVRAIRDAVHSDIDATRRVYSWVVELCQKLGASPHDMVPFDKYTNAALSLGSPSSAARALAGGAKYIERVDKLVQAIARQKGLSLAELDQTVGLVDGWLERNRAKG
jgi:hypothetical protein